MRVTGPASASRTSDLQGCLGASGPATESRASERFWKDFGVSPKGLTSCEMNLGVPFGLDETVIALMIISIIVINTHGPMHSLLYLVFNILVN